MCADGNIYWWGRFGMRTAGQMSPMLVNGLEAGIRSVIGCRALSLAISGDDKMFVNSVLCYVEYALPRSVPPVSVKILTFFVFFFSPAAYCGASLRPAKRWVSLL
jgi:hypothetical protein